MIASAFDPKPDDIPAIFRDRIDVHDAVTAAVWPTRVQTKKVARPVRPTNNRRCDYARLRARSMFPRRARMDRARIAGAHRLRSKAIFPPIWSPLREIALSYNVDHSTISRLKTRYAVEA